MMLRDVSYHYKIPLALTLVIALTAIVVSATLILRAYTNAKQELISNAIDLGRVLARTLRPALVHDELWQAYEIVATPLDVRHDASTQKRVITVLDAGGQIYVSSAPRRFESLSSFSSAGTEYSDLARRIGEWHGTAPIVADEPSGKYIHVVVPVLAEDNVRLGALVLSYSRDLFLPRFYDAVTGVLLSTLAVLAVLLPVGWLWGKRMADPMRKLAGAMAKIGQGQSEALIRGLPDGADEIGVLGSQFAKMLKELEEKKAMERQMLASERLAAIGRLSAGIAHEINNPLGGMLNAISTYRKHAAVDPVTLKTISLLERGLQQIRETVSALLVEARLETHALTPQDIDDTRTLIAHDALRKRAEVVWQSELSEPVALPSTHVRQILLNLLLNAVAAVRPHGRLECKVERVDGALRLAVSNEGEQIKRERLEQLYEPFNRQASESSGRSGLGLWVTYQLVQQLRGRIESMSGTSKTTFTVTLPIGS